MKNTTVLILMTLGFAQTVVAAETPKYRCFVSYQEAGKARAELLQTVEEREISISDTSKPWSIPNPDSAGAEAVPGTDLFAKTVRTTIKLPDGFQVSLETRFYRTGNAGLELTHLTGTFLVEANEQEALMFKAKSLEYSSLYVNKFTIGASCFN